MAQRSNHPNLHGFAMNISQVNIPPCVASSDQAGTSYSTSSRLRHSTPFNEESFKRCLRNLSDDESCSEDIDAGISYGSISDEQMADAWRIYRKTSYSTDDPFNPLTNIIGRLCIQDLQETTSEGPGPCSRAYGIDSQTIKNFGVVDTLSPAPPSLGMTEHGVLQTGNWSLLINDAFILGLIHGKKDITISSEINRSNVWNQNDHQFTVFGRELIALQACGAYRIDSSPNAVSALYQHSHDPICFGFHEYLEIIRTCRFNPVITVRELCRMAGVDRIEERDVLSAKRNSDIFLIDLD